jgi:thioredoxin-related protein
LTAFALIACRTPERSPVASDAPVWTRLEFGVMPEDTESYPELVVPALERAKHEGKLVLLYFHVQYSETCRLFRATILDDHSVAEWIGEHLVFVDVDMDFYPGVVHCYQPGQSNVSVLISSNGERFAWIPSCHSPEEYVAELDAALASR